MSWTGTAVSLTYHLRNSRTEPSLYAFDECYTAPQCGFRDALDYYRQCSAASLVPRLTMPCHILFAADDPLIDAHVFDAVALPPNVQVIRDALWWTSWLSGRPGRAGRVSRHGCTDPGMDYDAGRAS